MERRRSRAGLWAQVRRRIARDAHPPAPDGRVPSLGGRPWDGSPRSRPDTARARDSSRGGTGGGASGSCSDRRRRSRQSFEAWEVLHASAVAVRGPVWSRSSVPPAPVRAPSRCSSCSAPAGSSATTRPRASSLGRRPRGQRASGRGRNEPPRLPRWSSCEHRADWTGFRVVGRDDDGLRVIVPLEEHRLRLDRIYFLDRSWTGSDVSIEEARDPELVIGATFNLSIRSPERLVRQLEYAGRIAASTRAVPPPHPSGVGAAEVAKEDHGPCQHLGGRRDHRHGRNLRSARDAGAAALSARGERRLGRLLRGRPAHGAAAQGQWHRDGPVVCCWTGRSTSPRGLRRHLPGRLRAAGTVIAKAGTARR